MATDRKPNGSGKPLDLNAPLNKLSPMNVCVGKNLVKETKVKLPVQGRLGLDSPLLFQDDGVLINLEPGSSDSYDRHKYRSSNDGHLDLRWKNRREGALPVRACEQKPSNPATANKESAFNSNLERQSRNEYINLAFQIGYDGTNSAKFYENQIRKLMAESPCQERRLEILRASCSGQPRETVNLFLAPMKSVTTSDLIEKALDRLRQRYGVSGGLTTEPHVIEIRNGEKVTYNVSLLKAYNEHPNTLEVFAFAHDEFGKLPGQSLMNVANRLPGVLKIRYLNYLSQRGLDLNHLGFDSLRKLVAHELDLMTSDYAGTFFESDDKPRDYFSGRGPVKVRSVAVKPEIINSGGAAKDFILGLSFIFSLRKRRTGFLKVITSADARFSAQNQVKSKGKAFAFIFRPKSSEEQKNKTKVITWY